MRYESVSLPGIVLSAAVFFSNVFALGLLHLVGENGSWECAYLYDLLASPCPKSVIYHLFCSICSSHMSPD